MQNNNILLRKLKIIIKPINNVYTNDNNNDKYIDIFNGLVLFVIKMSISQDLRKKWTQNLGEFIKILLLDESNMYIFLKMVLI